MHRCTCRRRSASFTDFFAGIHHATNGGRRRDPNNPLSPNYKYVPVAYHSRASSVRPSNVPIRRPNGQRKAAGRGRAELWPVPQARLRARAGGLGRPRQPPGRADPDRPGRRAHCRARPRQRLVGARHPAMGIGSRSGRSSARASARPCRRGSSPPRRWRRSASPSRRGPPAIRARCPICGTTPISSAGAFDIALEALILTERMRAKGLPPHRMSASNTTDLYWTLAQFVAHHTSGGCNLRAGRPVRHRHDLRPDSRKAGAASAN